MVMGFCLPGLECTPDLSCSVTEDGLHSHMTLTARREAGAGAKV